MRDVLVGTAPLRPTGRSLAAVDAASEQGDVRHVGLEAVLLRQGLDHAVRHFHRGLDHPTAVTANQVQMPGVRR